jgi:hypothetical protein
LNNNRNNNRRRGRGNNRGGSNPSQSNRIDSRARGNAPQMLDKYRKLAQEAHLNDDRVQTEYYLQFADHYFRVMADMKAVKDDQRPRRDGERDQDGSDDDDDDGDDGYNRQDDRFGNRTGDRGGDRGAERQGPRRNPPGHREDSRRSDEAFAEEGMEGETGDQSRGENPFTRDAPKARQHKPREDKPAASPPTKSPTTARKPRKSADAADVANNDGGLDPDLLPPAIARVTRSAGPATADNAASADDEDGKTRPRGQLRTRTRPRDEGGEETLEAVG